MIHFIETLIPLARQVLLSDVRIAYTQLRNQEELWRQAFPDINDLPLLRFRQRRCTADQYFSSTYISAAYRRAIEMRKFRRRLTDVRKWRYLWRREYLPDCTTRDEAAMYDSDETTEELNSTDSDTEAEETMRLALVAPRRSTG